ncbi:MAG TPA: hypothetical protein VGR41_01930 [Actinomycetota bacterium]|jgi:hypothetical protein|nr:hypothetical protein [Actinomycetota bacterium]
MRNGEDQTPSAGVSKPETGGWVGPDLPSLSGVLIGSVMFITGGMLIFTVIGIPLGIPLFAAGLGLMLTPKERKK